MGLIALLVWSLIIFSIIIFILLFGESPRLRHGIVGKTHRFLTDQLPEMITMCLYRTVGQNNTRRLGNFWTYCCESRNPFMQIFFVALTLGSIGLFLVYASPHVPGNYLRPFHRIVIPVQIIALYGSYFVACTADPGTITKSNLQRHIDQYPYDGLVYEPKECSTCRFQKPARSKHCSMCKACIGRLDHHCAWINGCVGMNNHRYFFLFLFTLTEFCAYGAYLCVQIYRGMIVDWGLDQAYYYDSHRNQHISVSTRMALVHIMQRDRIIGALGILAGVISLVVFIFTAYQLYLAARGVTTNEAFKWEVIELEIDRGELWRGESDDEAPKNEKATPRRRHAKKSKAKETKGRMVESISEVDNIYDRGVIRNLFEVFFPPSLK